jgi:hypothetical protein
VKRIRRRRFRRIRIPPLCDEYPSWVPYIYLKGGKEEIILHIILEKVFEIRVSRRSFS